MPVDWNNKKVILGVDLSHYDYDNGVDRDDFRHLWKQGVRFCIIKCSQGSNWGYPNYYNTVHEFTVAARAAGMHIGYYHYMDQTDGAKQFDNFHNSLKRQLGSIPDDVFFAFDMEWNYGAKVYHATPFIRQFRKRFPRHRLLLYTASGYWGGLGNPNVKALWRDKWHVQLWNANWLVPRNVVIENKFRVNYGGFTKAHIWQTSRPGPVTAKNGRKLDSNIADMSFEEMGRWKYGSARGGGNDGGDTGTEPCPEGFSRDDNGNCVPIPCPEGYHRNDAGQCVPNTIEDPNDDSGGSYTEPWYNDLTVDNIITSPVQGTAAGIGIVVIGVVGLIIAGVAYFAYKNGTALKSIIDTGEKD